MAKTDIFNSEWVDIVFEGRNKEYGAYELRKQSERNIILAIILAIVFFTLSVSLPVILKYLEGLTPKEVVKVTDVNTLADIPPPPPDEAAPPPPPPPPPLKTTIKFTPPVIKEVAQEEDQPPPQEELEHKEVSTVTQEGDPNGVPAGLGDNPVVEEAAPQIFTIVEQMPEFPGGEASRMKFIQDKTMYPPLAKENNISGTVYVQFLVNPDGKISDVKILRGIGGGCDEEAARVVKLMPPWKAGKQNGRAVPVQFNMPFKFTLR